MVWKDILKNQKTFQSLGIGEIDLESSVENDEPKCLPIVLRHFERIKNLERYVTKVLKDSGQLHSSQTFSSDIEGLTPVTKNIHYFHPEMKSKMLSNEIQFAYSKQPISEEEACDFIEAIRGVKTHETQKTSHRKLVEFFGYNMVFPNGDGYVAVWVVIKDDSEIYNKIRPKIVEAFNKIFEEI